MTIELEGMRFKAYHGCLEHERKNGNTFEVDFRAEVPQAVRAAASDALEDSFDYGAAYRIIAAEMAVPSNMLEHVAGRIIRSFARNYPEIGNVWVRVSKACPPVGGECRWSRVGLSRRDLGI